MQHFEYKYHKVLNSKNAKTLKQKVTEKQILKDEFSAAL